MRPSARWKRGRLYVGALGVLLAVALTGRSEPKPNTTCLDLDALQRMSPEQLAELFDQADVGRPFVGAFEGRLLFTTDRRLPRLKVKMSNFAWKGKTAGEDGRFTNRWVGKVNAISSHVTIGPSWMDGRPAVVMEYAPGTPLFANSRDELREVAPGLYVGPLYERCPCPKLKGYLGLRLIDPCCDKGRGRR